MKLVDILARELKEWPDCEEIFQDYDGELRYMGNPVSTRSHCFVEMCDDLIRPKYGVNIKGITQPQWKEARDALLKADAKEWNGEGIPPVGAVCEILGTVGQELSKQEFSWVQVEIIAHTCFGGAPIAVGRDLSRATLGWGIASSFRPIRTPEQIAAEEREKLIDELAIATNYVADRHACEAVIDANYRKQETK